MTITVEENFDSYITYNGTATSGTVTTLTDTTQSWGVNALAGYYFAFKSGTGAGHQGTVISNTSNTITFSTTTAPDNTTTYAIGQPDPNWTKPPSQGVLIFPTTQGAVSAPNAFGPIGANIGGGGSNEIWWRSGSVVAADGAAQYDQTITTASSAGSIMGGTARIGATAGGGGGYLFRPNYAASPATLTIFNMNGTFNVIVSNASLAKSFTSGQTVTTKYETQAYPTLPNPYVECRFVAWLTGTAEPGSWDIIYDDPGYTIQHPGSGGTPGTYAISASGGGGTGVAGTYVINGSGGLASINFTNLGSGYTSAPTFSFAASGLTGQTFILYFDSVAGTVGPQLSGSYRGLCNANIGGNTALPDATIDNYWEGSVGTIFANQQTIAPNASNIYYSPRCWDITSSRAICSNPGAYIKMAFTGTSLSLALNQTTATQWIRYSVNNGPWTDTQVPANINVVPLASGLSAGNQTAEIHLLRNNGSNDRWGGWGGQVTAATSTTLTDGNQLFGTNALAGLTLEVFNASGSVIDTVSVISNTETVITVSGWTTQPDTTCQYAVATASGVPLESLTITNFLIDVGASLNAPTVFPNWAYIEGDSIVEGQGAISGQTGELAQDAVFNWVRPLMNELQVEYAQVGWGGSGLRQPGGGTAAGAVGAPPQANTAYQFIHNGVSALTGGVLSPAPIYAFLEHGVNGVWNSNDYLIALQNLRTICGSNCHIFACVPFGGQGYNGYNQITTNVVASGVASSGTQSALNDTTANFSPNDYHYGVLITAGTGAGEHAGIGTPVTSTQLPLVPPLATAPDNTSHYLVGSAQTLYSALYPNDKKISFINLGTAISYTMNGSGPANAWTADNLHPYTSWCAYIATALSAAINAILNPGGSAKNIFVINTGEFVAVSSSQKTGIQL